MKHLFKKISIVFALCLVSFLYFSCTQEKDYVNEKNRPKFDVKQKSFKEALEIPVFNTAYLKLAKKKGTFKGTEDARTALEDQFGFTIVADAPIRIITYQNGTIFYTILIERDIKEELKFENLMIQVKNNETSAAIFKYTIGDKGVISPTGEYTIKDIISTLYTDLNIEGKMFFNSNGDTCFDINVIRCNIPDHRPAGHIATQTCWDAFGLNPYGGSIYNSTTVVCMNDGSGGSTGGTGGASSGNSNNTGGLGASGGNTDPAVLSPIPCKTGNCIEADVLVDPCEELKKMKDAAMTNEFIRLKNLIASSGREKGSSVELSTTNFTDISIIPSISSQEGFNGVTWKKKANRIGLNHIHAPLSSNYQMFSIEDIISLNNISRAFGPNMGNINNNFGVFFVNLTVIDATTNISYTYSIKINPFDLSAFNAIGSIGEYTEYNILLDKYKDYGYPDEVNHTLLIYPFLQVASQYGIKLYRTKTDENKWSEISLDPDTSNTNPIITPCNNQ